MVYKKHFLSDVIIRLDLVSTDPPFVDTIDKTISDSCKRYFNKSEIRVIEQKFISINEKGFPSFIGSEKGYEWFYSNSSKSKSLVVSPKTILIATKNYITFEDLMEPFYDVVAAYLKVYNNCLLRRLGVRYVDKIDLFNLNKSKEISISSFWNKYIAKEIINPLFFYPYAEQHLSRNINILEWNYEDFGIKLQTGIFNSDNDPVSVKNKPFILDTDVFTTSIIEFNELKYFLEKFKNEANKLFELAIKPKLRNIMEINNDE
ncbi:MAG: TIGR04255 family protein [Deltaproteobacteria bacterium]|jgi:uncharacterized protein (TIGR04255 family)|nr:TIGR04255 family protein [Deltaproteobacteria bacterium]